MKFLTSRVVVFALMSFLVSFVAHAEDKVVGDGGKTGDTGEVVKSGSTPAIDYKVVTSKAYVDDEISKLAAHKVNGVAISNENIQFYAVETARNSGASATKTVQLSGGDMDSDATTIPTGMMLVIKPAETSTVVPTTLKLKRTSSDTTGISKSLRYNGAAITTDMAGKVWNANTPSIWVYDGTYWDFAGGGTVADGLIDGLASHTVNGAPLSNLASVFFGPGEGSDGADKKVTIDSIASTEGGVPPTGLIIVTQPTDSDSHGNFALTLNRFNKAPVFYNGAPVNDRDASAIWSIKKPSSFVFDGTNWVFLGTVDTDTNTEYSTMSVDEGTAGQSQTQRVLTAQNLKPIIQGTTLTGLSTSTASVITTSDTVTTGMGKLQAQITANDVRTHTVNGAPLSNTASYFYGTGVGVPDNAAKTVEIDSIYSVIGQTTPNGQMIVVQPEKTATKGNITLQLNKFNAAPVYYNGDVLNDDDVSKVWNKGYPSTFVFDGTNWVFMGNGQFDTDTNTEYSTMSVNEGTAGQSQTQRTLTAQNLKPIIQGTTLTGVDTTATTAVTASDTVTTGIGKLQGQINDLSSHKINGMPLSGFTSNGDAMTSMYFYGTSDAAAADEVRNVTIGGITELAPGLMIIVKPTITAAYGNADAAAAAKLNLNGLGAKGMRYNGAALTTTNDGYAWKANTPGLWLYDGTYWNFAGYDANNTYNAMTDGASGSYSGPAGTATTNTVVSPKVLKNTVLDGITLTANTGRTAFDSTIANTPITASDKVIEAFGHAQGQINNKQNKIDATWIEVSTLDNSDIWQLRGIAASNNAATDINATEIGLMTNNDVYAILSYNNEGHGLVDANYDFFQSIGQTGRYEELENLVPTVAAVGEAFGELRAFSWDSTKHPVAIDAYSTTFSNSATNAWPVMNETKAPSGSVLANALALKQNKIAAGTAGNVVTYSGTAGQFGTPLSIMDGLSSYGEVAVLDNAYNFGDPETSQTTVWPLAEATQLINGRAFADGLSLKQTVLPVTSNGMGNGPNYVYNATTNPTADGSVVTTTTTAGTVGQRGIATAPTYDANDNLTNGSWLPTMSAVESMVSGSDVSSHKVNGAPLSNTASYFYGEGVGAADTATKTVSIPSITGTPAVGQVIVVKPATTNTSSTININLNNTAAYSVLYRGSSSNIPKDVWTAYVPSIFVLDETSGGTKYWRYVGTSPSSMAWGATETNATNAYSTTFDGTTNNWPVADENKYVKGDSFAQGLALKQNRITTNLVSFNDTPNGATYNVPALVSYGTGTNNADGILGNKIGIVGYGNIGEDLADYEEVGMDNYVPTVYAVAAALSAIWEGMPSQWQALSWNVNGDNGANRTNAINAYNTTFGTGTNNWAGTNTNLINGQFLANSLALKQNKIPAGTTPENLYTNGSVLTYTNSDGVVGEKHIINGQMFEDLVGGRENWTNDYQNMLVNAGDIGTMLKRLDWSSTQSAAINAYNTTFGTGTNNWTGNDGNLINGQFLANSLALKQNKIPAGTAGEILTYSGTAGQLGTPWAVLSSLTGEDGDAIENYSTTFNGTDGNWTTGSAGKLITTNVLADGLALKQTRISTGLVEFEGNEGNYQLPAIVRTDALGDLLDGTSLGIFNFATYQAEDAYQALAGYAEGATAAQLDNFVPTLRVVAEELKAIESKQNKLPAAYASTTDPSKMASMGGETIALGSYAGSVSQRYITAGGSQPLTQKTGADNVMLYINGTKTLAQFQTSNFGATGGTATTIQGRIKESLVNLETLKDVYSELQESIESSDVSSHKVNGAPLSNTASYFYGEGVGEADTSTKTVSIPSITGTPAVGQVIIVKPATTNTASTIKINLNNTAAYSVLYRGSTTNIPSEAWTAYVPSIFVLDETSGGTKYWRYVGTSPSSMAWGATETNATNAYSTTFDGTTNNWPTADENKYVKADSLAYGLALKQNALPAQASGAPVTIPTYPAYGTSDGVIGKMYLDTSSLYTANDEHFPSSKLIRTTLSSYVPKSYVLNTNDTNSYLADDNSAPSWATTNGVASLYRVPGAASGSNWAATAMSKWANDENVPTMDTLANSLAGLYDAVGVSVEDRILNYDETGYSIVGESVPVPSQIEYTGELKLKDGNQLFWLPQLQNAGVEEATRLLKSYSMDKIVPSMDELAFALDGVLQTHETTREWQEVVNFYRVPSSSLFEVAKEIEASEVNAVALYKSGYLQTFAPSLEALMNESAELVRLINSKQNKLSGTSGNLITYGATAGTTGSKEIATTITNNANTVPNTQAVYNAVNARQNVIPVAGKYRSSNTATSDTPISDWTVTDIKGTALVTKPTSSDGVVGERKIFEAGDTYTDDTKTNIQIATIGAVMENTFTKTCVEYAPGSTQNDTTCWLWQLTSNTVTSTRCSASGVSCRSSTECCSGICRSEVCAATLIACGGEGSSCSLIACCDGLTCDSSSNTCVREAGRT
ncbi:MAG: hypothetical protein IJL21_03990 [Alphaproteobacteria bacterium]|nr:hypothetical protein [Alphaproteobacteria bacterium]